MFNFCQWNIWDGKKTVSSFKELHKNHSKFLIWKLKYWSLEEKTKNKKSP